MTPSKNAVSGGIESGPPTMLDSSGSIPCGPYPRAPHLEDAQFESTGGDVGAAKPRRERPATVGGHLFGVIGEQLEVSAMEQTERAVRVARKRLEDDRSPAL